MGSAEVVVEISSDEEDFPVTKKVPVDSFGWITGHLQVDDLEVMGELSAPAVPQNKTKPAGDEEDDDCVVLDGDPDDVVTVVEEKGREGDGSSDELQIVAEKGPVACRDFPHSRHLCSNLPFSTTSHVNHCSMCHCFVCDTPAPCTYWGKGTEVNDHCHATDKENWKTLRQAFKFKSLPTSHPEKCQNVVYPLVRSHPTSLANQSHLANAMNQSLNQTRHTSVGALSMVRTVPAARASPAARTGRVTSNAPTIQITQSRTRFKRVGATSPGLATLNDNQFGSAAPNNALLHQPSSPQVSQPVQVTLRTTLSGSVQKAPPQRSLSAPIAFQEQQGRPASYYQTASNGTHGTEPQFPRCTSLTAQRTQFLQEPVMDVCSKSWRDILDSVASDLGVSDYNMDPPEFQQPVETTPQPQHTSAFHGVDLLHSESVLETANLMPSNGQNVCDVTTGSNGATQTAQILSHLNHQPSLIPNEAHLMGDVHHRDAPGSDSTDIVFDFELEDWLPWAPDKQPSHF
ncbi:hypothetical protein ABZP36_010525 [Zizania latifolia]